MDVVAIDEDCSLVGVVESLEERYHGGFSAARWSDEGDELAALDFDIEICEQRCILGGVAECDVVELDVGSGAGSQGLWLSLDVVGFFAFGFARSQI